MRSKLDVTMLEKASLAYPNQSDRFKPNSSSPPIQRQTQVETWDII
jgi:hypothetical protein